MPSLCAALLAVGDIARLRAGAFVAITTARARLYRATDEPLCWCTAASGIDFVIVAMTTIMIVATAETGLRGVEAKVAEHAPTTILDLGGVMFLFHIKQPS